MANMMDYLDWRGDLPFSSDSFNHVDNLILSELAYVGFDGIVPGSDSSESIGIQEVNDEFWKRHTLEEVKKERTLYHLAPMLLQKASASTRYAGTRLSGYINRVSADEGEQMSAVTFHLDNGLTYVSFRGTDDTITGWKEDFHLGFMEETAGQRMAAEYLSRQAAAVKGELFVGGHSKGGNFAVYAAAFCEEKAREKIRRVYTNDGPGFLETVTHSLQYRDILPRIVSIIPEESVFGLLLDSGYPYTTVKSSNHGVWQHDAMSWEVMGNHFVEMASTNKTSRFLEKTVAQWLSGISLEERRRFVNTIFEIIAATGKDTLSSFQTDGLKAALEIINSYQKMKKEEKEHVRKILQQLFAAGADVLETGGNE